jgi:hypothetical protein
MSGPAEDPRKGRPDLPGAQAAAIVQALSREASARPADAGQFLGEWKKK